MRRRLSQGEETLVLIFPAGQSVWLGSLPACTHLMVAGTAGAGTDNRGEGDESVADSEFLWRQAKRRFVSTLNRILHISSRGTDFKMSRLEFCYQLIVICY